MYLMITDDIFRAVKRGRFKAPEFLWGESYRGSRSQNIAAGVNNRNVTVKCEAKLMQETSAHQMAFFLNLKSDQMLSRNAAALKCCSFDYFFFF